MVNALSEPLLTKFTQNILHIRPSRLSLFLFLENLSYTFRLDSVVVARLTNRHLAHQTIFCQAFVRSSSISIFCVYVISQESSGLKLFVPVIPSFVSRLDLFTANLDGIKMTCSHLRLLLYMQGVCLRLGRSIASEHSDRGGSLYPS